MEATKPMVSETQRQYETISVIVPVYNVEQYLRKCLDSIINQTYAHLEIILVDDGSTDSSGAICDEYAARDARIRVYHKPNGGLSSARNYGLDRMSGDYIAYVDSDDWLDLDLYRRCIEKFQGKPDIDAVYYEFDDVLPAGERRHYCYRLDVEGRRGVHDIVYNDLLQQYIWGYYNPAVWAKIYKAPLVKDLRFVEGKNYEDVVYTFLASARVRGYALLAPQGTYTGYFYNKLNVGSISHSLKVDIADLYDQLFSLYDAVIESNPALLPYIGSIAYRELINRNINLSKQKAEVSVIIQKAARRIAKMEQLPAPGLKDKLKRAFLRLCPSLFALFFCSWVPKLKGGR